MARKRLERLFAVLWDRDAAKRLQDEAEVSLEKAGKTSGDALQTELAKGGQKGARALISSLNREYKLRVARLQQELAEGLIDERRFRKEGEEAAREFNRGLTDGIRKLQASTGGLTDAQFAGLAGRFKRTGSGVTGLAVGAGRFLGPLAGFLTAGAALSEARTAIEAANELENSITKLGGTARLTGIDLAFLEENAAKARETFRLSVPIANDLTTEVTRLTEKAGEIEQTSAALAAFLDIGAARGLSAEQTLQAVSQAILGIDEGTDKLFGKNPSVIYAEFADKVGLTASKMTDQEKALALVDAALSGGERVRGQYLEWLETSVGQEAQHNVMLREKQAELGRTIRPLQLVALELRTGLYEVLVNITSELAAIAGFLGKTWTFLVDVQASFGGKRLDDVSDWVGLLNPITLFQRAGARIGARARETPEAPATPVERKLPWWEQNFANLEHMLATMDADAIERPLSPLPSPEELEKQIKTIDDRLRKWMMSSSHWDLMTRLQRGAPDGTAGLDLALRETGPTALEVFGEQLARFDEIATDVAFHTANVWQDTFALMIEEGANVGNFFEGMARGVAGSLGSILAQFAAEKAKEHFAAAIGAGAYALGFTSFGNFGSAAAAWASAAEHTAAGIAYSALAGGGAAAQGAVRSRGPGSTFDEGLSTAGRAIEEGGGMEVHIYIDPLDPYSPRYQENVYAAQQFASERYGEEARVHVHPARAR